MKMTSYQWLGNAASAALQVHWQDTRTQHDLIRKVSSQNGIRPLSKLPTLGQLRCSSIFKPSCHRACRENAKSVCAQIVNHPSGFTQKVLVDEVNIRANSIQNKQEMVQPEMLQEANRNCNFQYVAIESAMPWCEAFQVKAARGNYCHVCFWNSSTSCADYLYLLADEDNLEPTL